MEHPIDGKDSGGEQTGSNFEREFQSTRQAVFGERQIFNLKDRETVPEEFPYFGSRFAYAQNFIVITLVCHYDYSTTVPSSTEPLSSFFSSDFSSDFGSSFLSDSEAAL